MNGCIMDYENLTATDVRSINKNRIFRTVHGCDGVSRQEIAEQLKLSLPTINQNLKLLLEEGLIVFEGNYDSTGGRRAQVIRVNGTSRVAVGVNILADCVRVYMVNLNGSIIGKSRVDMPFKDDNTYYAKISETIDTLLEENNINKDTVLGVGITVPGVFNEDNTTIIMAPQLRIRNYDINKLLSNIPYKAMVINDARANAFADYWYEKMKSSNVVSGNCENGKQYLMLSEGVGGAYINSEGIMSGAHNRRGEFGHMTLHPNGRKCMCGKCGCFETYVSSRCLSSDLGISLEEFFNELEHNKEYGEVFEAYLKDLTTGVNNMYIMFDGDVVVGGEMSKYLRKYEEQIRSMLIEKYSFDTDGSYFSISQCTSGEADCGAALMFLADFIKNI